MRFFTVALCVLCVCLSVFCDNRGSGQILADLDLNSTQKFDTYVRREILFLVLGKLNETNYEQLSTTETCDARLNKTAGLCLQCSHSQCPNENNDKLLQSLNNLRLSIFKPALELSTFIDQMGKSIPEALGLLGDESGLFLMNLASLSSLLGNGLQDGHSDGLSQIASKLESLGQKLSLLSKDMAKIYVSSLPDLSHSDLLEKLVEVGAKSLLDQVQSGFSSFGSALKDFGNTVVNGLTDAGKAVGDLFSNIFGKRSELLADPAASCTQNCPNCDKIDTNAHDTMTALATVCGEGIVYSQRNVKEQVIYLQRIFNDTLLNELVTKVEYDPTSIKTDNRVAFSTSFVSFLLDGLTHRFQSEKDFEISDLKKSAKDVAGYIWSQMN